MYMWVFKHHFQVCLGEGGKQGWRPSSLCLCPVAEPHCSGGTLITISHYQATGSLEDKWPAVDRPNVSLLWTLLSPPSGQNWHLNLTSPNHSCAWGKGSFSGGTGVREEIASLHWLQRTALQASSFTGLVAKHTVTCLCNGFPRSGNVLPSSVRFARGHPCLEIPIAVLEFHLQQQQLCEFY